MGGVVLPQASKACGAWGPKFKWSWMGRDGGSILDSLDLGFLTELKKKGHGNLYPLLSQKPKK